MEVFAARQSVLAAPGHKYQNAKQKQWMVTHTISFTKEGEPLARLIPDISC
jgi:hypothetical protein